MIAVKVKAIVIVNQMRMRESTYDDVKVVDLGQIEELTIDDQIDEE